MFRTRWIRKLLARNNSLGRRHRQLTTTRKPVRLRLEALEDRVVPSHCHGTEVDSGHAEVKFSDQDHHHADSCVLPVTVKDLEGGYAHSGTVTCKLQVGDKTYVVGSADVDKNGVANCKLDFDSVPDDLKPGNYKLEEDFEGDNDDYYSCQGSGSLTFDAETTTVTPVNVTINSSNSSTVQSFSVSVTVNCSTGPVNSGTVSLNLVAGNTTINLGTATVGSNGVATISVTDQDTLDDIGDLKPGTYELEETFTGDDSFAGSSTTCTFTITSQSSATTLAVPNVTMNGGSSTAVPPFSVAVAVNSTSGTVNEGNVAINLVTPNGNINLGTAAVGSNGVATVTVSNQDTLQDIGNLPPGSYELVETYSGSSHFAGASATSTLTITSPSTPTTLAVPNVTINAGSSTSIPPFTVAVAVNSPTATVNAGTITLQLVTPNGTITLGTGTVGPNGVATITVSDEDTLQDIANLPPGSYELVETYSGSGPFVGSSATSTLTIANTPTTITVPNVTVNVNVNGTPSSFTINLNVTTPTGPVTSGTVTIDLVNGPETISLGTATPGPNGTFTLTVTGPALTQLGSLPPGTYQINVEFTGAPGSTDTSSSTPGTLIIQPSSVLPELASTTPTGGGPGSGAPSAPSSGLTPIQAALQLALEAAMLGNLSNPGSVGELEAFADVFLGHGIPTSLPQLMSDISSLVPQAGPMLGPALGFASFLDFDLPIENPT